MVDSATDERRGPDFQLEGVRTLLNAPLVGFFASERTPPSLILPVLDWLACRAGGGDTVISGFQSRLERDGLEVLLAAQGRAVWSRARSICGMKLSHNFRSHIDEGLLLVLGLAEMEESRADLAAALRRNRWIVGMATSLFIPFAKPGWRTFSLAADAIKTGIPVQCLAHPGNGDLLLLGAREFSPGE